MGAIKNIRTGKLIQSGITIAIGLVIAIWSSATIDFIARALAVLLIGIGAILIISYLRRMNRNFELRGSFIAGLIITAIGVWIFSNPGKFTDFIPKLFGIFIFLSGLDNVGQTVSLIKNRSKSFWASLATAMVTVFLGAFLLVNPTGAKEIAVTLIGIFLIINGVTNLINSMLLSSYIDNSSDSQKTIDVEAVIIDDDDDNKQ